jgi:transcriptional regulator with XRE-family HTH domain
MKYSLDTLEQRLRYTRKKVLAMNQEEFADVLNVSRDVISRYETGKTRLPSKQAAKIVELANVSADWLLSGKGEMPVKSKEGVPAEVVASRINVLESDLKRLRGILKGEEGEAELEEAEKAAFNKTGEVIRALTELEIRYRDLTGNPDEWKKLGEHLERLKTLIYREFIKTK